MVYVSSQVVTRIFDGLLWPFGTHRTLALSVISLVVGVVIIFIFKHTSNQKEIRRTRDRVRARILEMRIYQNDLVLIHKALFGAMAANLAYLRVSLKAIVVLIVVVGLVFIQLDERYGRRALEPGETTLLTVQLKNGLDPVSLPVYMAAGDGLVATAPPVRVSTDRAIHWRLRAAATGTQEVTLNALGKSYRMPVRVEVSNTAIGRNRKTGAVWSPLLHPSLPRLPEDSPIERVSLDYPSAQYTLFGWKTHWLVVFIVFSFIGALVPKFLLKIEV